MGVGFKRAAQFVEKIRKTKNVSAPCHERAFPSLEHSYERGGGTRKKN